MDYALDLLTPILLGLFAGYWLHQQWGFSELWMVIFAILGLFAGLWILYKRFQPPSPSATTPATDDHKKPPHENHDNP